MCLKKKEVECLVLSSLTRKRSSKANLQDHNLIRRCRLMSISTRGTARVPKTPIRQLLMRDSLRLENEASLDLVSPGGVGQQPCAREDNILSNKARRK